VAAAHDLQRCCGSPDVLRAAGQEQLRIAVGAGVQTRDNPAVPLEQFQPTADTGGLSNRGAASKRPLRLAARAAAR